MRPQRPNSSTRFCFAGRKRKHPEPSGAPAGPASPSATPNPPVIESAHTRVTAAVFTPVEGIEEFNVEYGIDSDGDGQPDAYMADPTTFTYPGCIDCTAASNWANVVTAKLHVLARSPDPSPGHIDTKTYALGHDNKGNAITVGPQESGYRRYVYTALVRLVNPAGRRDRP